MKRYYVLIFLLAMYYGAAQTGWKADLPVVDESGYYTIELDQEVIGAGLEYLKFFDTKQNSEVPYFIRSADPIQEINSFEAFTLKSNLVKDSLNILIVDNANAENLNRFCIILQKAETEKFAAIRGSNDLKQWYTVKQATGISRLGKQSRDNTEMQVLDFPQGNYRYYEITLWNSEGSPLDILQVGKIKNSNLYGHFVSIPTGVFIQENDDDNHNTFIRFPDVPHIYCIHKIEFNIKNKPYYYRNAFLKDTITYQIETISLSSDKDNIFFISDFYFSSATSICIENEQNPPVSVDSVKLYGLSRYACIYLEAGQRYRLLSDRRDPVSTRYDIEHFRDKIPADLPVLQTINLQPYVVQEEVAPERKPSFIEQPVFLWGIIIVVGIFLIFICLRMISEMKKKQG